MNVNYVWYNFKLHKIDMNKVAMLILLGWTPLTGVELGSRSCVS